MNRSDLRPGDCRRHPRQYRGVDAARSSLHSISGHCARDRHHRHLPRPLLARAFRRARPSLPSLPAADGTVALGDLERAGVVLRRDIQDERDRLSVRAPLWRHVAIVVSGDCGGQRPSYRFPFRLELSRRSEAAPGGLLAPLPAARLLLHVPALQRRAARPHLRPRPRRELHFGVDHPSCSGPRLGLGVPHSSPRAARRETPLDGGLAIGGERDSRRSCM